MLRFFLLAICFPISSQAVFAPANRPMDVLNYKITLKLDPEAKPETFQGEVEIQVKAKGPLAQVVLDRDELEVEGALLLPERTTLKIDQKEKAIVAIELPKPLSAGDTATLLLSYRAKIYPTNKGFFRVADPDNAARGPLYFSHLEALGARSFFPCNDEPYDKATSEMVATVPADFQALSNGLILTDTPVQEGARSWHTVHWKQDLPHSTYLVSLAIGRFVKLETLHQGKPVQIWGPPGREDKMRYALDSTVQSILFFETFLGVPYPWRKYATVLLPTFVWGGMENTSSTHMNQERTLLNDPLSESEKGGITGLAAHELAHQWFGDYATLQWWDDLWLNESFASYLGSEATQAAFSVEEVEIERVLTAWDRYFRQENGPRSHPIVDKKLESADEAFDAISYTKGENVLRMLEFYVGRENLRKGMHKYLGTYGLSNATYRNFFDSVASASGMNLDAFRDTWLLQRGYPVLTHEGEWDSKNKKYTVVVHQHSNHEKDPSLFHFRIPVSFHRKTAPAFDREAVWEISAGKHSFVVDLPAEPDWVSVNTGSVVLAKVLQRQRNEKVLALQAVQDPDALTRVRAAYDLSTSAREGEAPLSIQAQKALIEVLRKDPSPSVRLSVLDGFQKMKTRWLPRELGIVLLELAKAPAPDTFSDRAKRQWSAGVWGALGKVKDPNVLGLLSERLKIKDLPLDDLAAAAHSTAVLGSSKGAQLLKEALRRHQPRGYRYSYVVQFAFGSFENASAAAELSRILSQCSSDLAGRLGYAVSNNQTLKNSPEWARFLAEFVLTDRRHGEEVKSRMLMTVEEVKTEKVKQMLERLQRKADSQRIQGMAQKILAKNFSTSNSL